jgi:GDP-L-fucose synthase
MKTNSRVCVFGHRGLVGSALTESLQKLGHEVLVATRSEVDLREQVELRQFFEQRKPQYVFMAAGTVGGIVANSTRPAEFIYDNTLMCANVVDCCRRYAVDKLMLLGSTCIYPKHAPQPIREECLLTGPLEPTNEWYAVAKINAIKIGQAYRSQYGTDIISVMPTNLYGPRDNFDLVSSHVMPALIRKMHEAKSTGAPEVTLWGTGSPRREFLHVQDLVDALLFLMNHYSEPEIVNVGTGSDLTIAALAALVAEAVGYRGRIAYDTSKPDGTPIKCSDSSKLLALGWKPKIDLVSGIRETYLWFLDHVDDRRN